MLTIGREYSSSFLDYLVVKSHYLYWRIADRDRPL